MRLARAHAACDLLGIGPFDEETRYANRAWLAGVQAAGEDRLLAQRPKTKPVSRFLDEVTSSSLEGTHNARAALGYNRAGTKGKRPIGIGLLCDEAGQPVSIAVLPGNTHEPQTFAAQLTKVKARCGVHAITLVGARGMSKGPPIEALAPQGRPYITAMTQPQREKWLPQGTSPLDRCAQALAEGLADEGRRYVRRRNSVRAQAVRDTRDATLAKLQVQVAKKKQALPDHPRARARGAVPKLLASATQLRIADGVERTGEERSITLHVNTSAQQDEATLDGWYVLQPDLTPAQAPKAMVHDRYKALASVEHALRTGQPAHLAGRPSFVRREARPRAHAFVVMLAYQILQYRTACWSALDCTVEEGLQALATLCLSQVSPQHAPSYHCLPTPRDAIAHLLPHANSKLPQAFSLSGTRVSTKKKLPSERLGQ